MMIESDIHEFCAALNVFYCGRFNYKKPYCNSWHNKINARSHKYTLTLSWDASERKISITAISFAKKNVGHGTALLALLVELSGKYGYETIEYISVLTDAMKCFVQKFEFENLPGAAWPGEPELPSKNWSKPVIDLKRLLQDKNIS
ncbi:hypothetical protein [Cellvibrio sp. PSBB023]|uniref:hypothetical protein n=1 Tax=Cellvibrio sp. PSBB023 TaxID=1945512 RepID=UPI00122E9E49|nr:hypothetical protein [Cellvibrio sp. PSBB023]